ncbi:type II secretion system F family protein [Roseateles sp.]|uniref:type II secretion system F family protein n=1 Tax=Roseateles sp. TaxID=1971397 RepID=UPI003BABD4F8
MTAFRYRALDAGGQALVGQIEAATEAEAARRLIRQGMTPLSLEAIGVPAARLGIRRGAVTAIDRIVLLRELATLLKAGVALDEALGSLSSGHAAGGAGAGLARVHLEVRSGKSLHDALRDSGLNFAPYVLTLVRVGDISGQLGQALADSAEQLDAERRLLSEMRNALIYPAVLVVAGVLAVLIIFLGVIPKFAPMLKSSRTQAPDFSMWIIESAVYFKVHLLPIGLGVMAVVGVIGVSLARPAIRQAIVDFCGRTRLLGPWLRDAEVGRWAMLTGTMLRNRVPLIEALKLSRAATRLRDFDTLLASVVRSIEDGRSLHEAMSHGHWIQPSRLNLVRVGERAGSLDAMLLSLGGLQSEAARERQKTALALIEPVAILLIGAVIGVLMISVMLAITSMNNGAI